MAKTLKTKIDEFISQQGNQSGLAGLDEILLEIANSASGANTAVAPEYEKTTYAKGALVFHEGELYKANAAIETAEDWTAAHWTKTSVAAELAGKAPIS